MIFFFTIDLFMTRFFLLHCEVFSPAKSALSIESIVKIATTA